MELVKSTGERTHQWDESAVNITAVAAAVVEPCRPCVKGHWRTSLGVECFPADFRSLLLNSEKSRSVSVESR